MLDMTVLSTACSRSFFAPRSLARFFAASKALAFQAGKQPARAKVLLDLSVLPSTDLFKTFTLLSVKSFLTGDLDCEFLLYLVLVSFCTEANVRRLSFTDRKPCYTNSSC